MAKQIFRKGTPLTVIWSLTKPDGTAMDLAGYRCRLYYATGNRESEATSTVVSANNISWVFAAAKQTIAGDYRMKLRLYQNGGLFCEINYEDAFSLFEGTAETASVQSQEAYNNIVNLHTVAEYYLLKPVVPVVGDDLYWYVNGVKLVDSLGQYVSAEHTVDYDQTTHYIIIDKDRVDAQGQSIAQTITAIAEALKYIADEGDELERAEGQGDYSDPDEYPDTRRAQEVARQQAEEARQAAEGDENSVPGDGSRRGNELQRMADEGSPEDEPGADTRWGAEKARREAEGTPDDDPADPDVNTRWAQFKRAIIATLRANRAAEAAEHQVDVKRGYGIAEVTEPVVSNQPGGRNTIRLRTEDNRSYDVYVYNGRDSHGLFADAAALAAEKPNPAVGDYAFVGTAFPADIYVCVTAGTWEDSGNDYDGPTGFEMEDSLDSDDPTKALSAKQGKTLDGKISQLGQYVGFDVIVELETAGQNVQLPRTIPAGTKIYSINGYEGILRGRTNSGDGTYQTISNGITTDRDINYVNGTITGFVKISAGEIKEEIDDLKEKAEAFQYLGDNILIDGFLKTKVYKNIKELAIEKIGYYWNVSTSNWVANSAYNTYTFNAVEHNIRHIEGKRIYVRGYSGSNARLIAIYRSGTSIVFPNTTTAGIYEAEIDIPEDAITVIINEQSEQVATEVKILDRYSYRYSSPNNRYDILYGKKLCSAGDSLTAGVQAEVDPDTGEHKTYAYIVAKNNSMEFTNVGLSGDCIGDTTINGVQKKGFANHRYNEIPSNLDYLSIFYGWNDEAYGPMQYKDAWCYEHYGSYYNSCTAEQKATCDAAEDWTTMYIGSINDNTTATWCGAWNIVLNYYRRNMPNMKVGVILPFVGQEVYRTSLKDVCKKYGVPYISSNNPNEWFITSRGDGLCSEMQTYLASIYTADGLHPNTLGHLMESSQYEHFLRSI